MTYLKIVRVVVLLLTILACCVIAPGCSLLCSLLCPAAVQNVALAIDTSGDKADTARPIDGEIFIQPFEIASEYNYPSFILKTQNGLLKIDEKHGWGGNAAEVIEQFWFKYFSYRFPNKMHISALPVPEYIVEGKILNFSITAKSDECAESVCVDVYVLVKQRIESGYEVAFARDFPKSLPVQGMQPEIIGTAMSSALGDIAKQACDMLQAHAASRPKFVRK